MNPVALITGASRGIGRGIALELSKIGYDFVINFASNAAAARQTALDCVANAKNNGHQIRAEICQADVASVGDRQRLIDFTRQTFGRLDLLVNNASTFFAVGIGEIEASHWEDLVGSNLRAPLFIVQEAAAELAKNEGSIVNIVDIHAERPLKGYPLYSVAKAGLAALTRSLALELAPRVRVNGVSPGTIAWPDDGQFTAEERSRIVATTPLARIGAPEDIAQAVHFLACAPYVTGQIIAVDGGRSVFI